MYNFGGMTKTSISHFLEDLLDEKANISSFLSSLQTAVHNPHHF